MADPSTKRKRNIHRNMLHSTAVSARHTEHFSFICCAQKFIFPIKNKFNRFGMDTHLSSETEN